VLAFGALPQLVVCIFDGFIVILIKYEAAEALKCCMLSVHSQAVAAAVTPGA